MADVLSPEQRHRNMVAIKGKNTKPELVVRRFLHSKGLRYRLHDSRLPGKPDLVFPKYKVVIFVQGCFWHGHAGCRFFRIPGTRTEFWQKKINSNIARDAQNREKLEQQGWKVIFIWECQLKHEKDNILEMLYSKIIRNKNIK